MTFVVWTGASEGEFGLAMGMYFLAYAPAQLIVGRMLDRFGTRVVVAPAAIIVALGCLLLASTDSIVLMGVGRFLQGLGSSVAYLGVVYLALVWFPPHRHGHHSGYYRSDGKHWVAALHSTPWQLPHRIGGGMCHFFFAQQSGLRLLCCCGVSCHVVPSGSFN